MPAVGASSPARFRRVSGSGAAIRVTVDGAPVEARAGDTVAALLLVAGYGAFQVNKHSGAPRGPFCLMGVCFECLVTIDDMPDRQACMVQVRDGMRIETQGHTPRRTGS